MAVLLGAAITSPAVEPDIPRCPLEQKSFESLTTHREMLEYVGLLAARSRLIELGSLGRSVEGREIPVLWMTADSALGSRRATKPVVLVYSQQHGDEPSGMEASLMLARHLATEGRALLDKLDLIVVAQVNPDGAERGQRNNANDMDLNRNHLCLSEPEALALHGLFLEWMPEVTLDVHEYSAISEEWIGNGMIKDAEVMVGGVTNPNIDPEIMEMARKTLIPDIGDCVRADGYSFHRYVVGSPFEGSRMRYSTTDINDARQSMGIYNTVSFIQEGKQYGDLVSYSERRARSQVSGMLGLLNVVADHADSVLALVKRCRERVLGGEAQGWAHVQLDYFPDPNRPAVTFPVFDLKEWKRVDKDLERFEPQVRVKKSVRRPCAYVVEAGHERLAELLERHQVSFSRLPEGVDLEVESYAVLHVTPMTEEEITVPNVDVLVETGSRRFEAGTLIVPLEQAAGLLLPLMLEPQSTRGIVSEEAAPGGHFGDLLREGWVYPVHRLMHPPPDPG